MTYVPEFWWKRWRDLNTDYEYIQISDREQQGYTKSEAFYIGRYNLSILSSVVIDKSGTIPETSSSPSSYRTYAQNIGTGWGLMDIWKWSMLQMLYLVEYADYDSQAKLGYGYTTVTSSDRGIDNGSCNSLGMKSGCLNNDGTNGVIYRGIENVFGNVGHWLDGITLDSYGNIYVSRDRSMYSFTINDSYYDTSFDRISRSGYISRIGCALYNNFELQLPTQANGSDNTYCPDYYSNNNGMGAVVGGHFANMRSQVGLWCLFWENTSGTGNYYYRFAYSLYTSLKILIIKQPIKNI